MTTIREILDELSKWCSDDEIIKAESAIRNLIVDGIEKCKVHSIDYGRYRENNAEFIIKSDAIKCVKES